MLQVYLRFAKQNLKMQLVKNLNICLKKVLNLLQ